MNQQPQLFEMDVPPWELDSEGECKAARVVFSEAPHGPLDYRVPDALLDQVQVGVRLKVPLGRSNREMLGYCIAVETVQRPPEALKPVTEVVDVEPLCTPKVLELLQWMSTYYLAPLGQVFEAAIPAGVRASAGSRQRMVLYPSSLADDPEVLDKLSPKQSKIMRQLVVAGGGVTQDQLQKMVDCSTGPINLLRQRGFIETRQERWIDGLVEPKPSPTFSPLALSADQRQALAKILDALDSKKQKTILLHGVTGSGKTEVYIQAIHETISYGRQAIVLVPEISLTPQTRRRFVERFGEVAVLHSHMSAVERHHQWRKIAAGITPVVIGPRSAIFAPTPRLGLVVLDEEHETTFKQDNIPRYHARDVALHRAYLEQIPLVLGSATPSLETWKRAQDGKYQLASLPRRIHNRPLPEVSTIDLRSHKQEPARGAISRPLHQAIVETLDEGWSGHSVAQPTRFLQPPFNARSAATLQRARTVTYRSRNIEMAPRLVATIVISKCPLHRSALAADLTAFDIAVSVLNAWKLKYSIGFQMLCVPEWIAIQCASQVVTNAFSTNFETGRHKFCSAPR